MSTAFFEQLQSSITNAKHIAVTCHVNPDGDALWSSLPIVILLRALWKSVDHRIPTDISEWLTWMSSLSWVESNVGQLLENHWYDLVITTDTSTIDRSCLQEITQDALGSSMYWFIDHHQSNTVPQWNLFNIANSSSTCEIVANRLMNWKPNQITSTMATLLYTWMVTDTWNFRWWEDAASTHQTVSKLYEYNIDRQIVELSLYRALSPAQLELIWMFLTRIKHHNSVYYSHLYKSEVDAKGTDMRALTVWTSLLYALNNAEWVYLTMRCVDNPVDWPNFDPDVQECIKISLRTASEKINVATIAEQFWWWGHQKAAWVKLIRNWSFEEMMERIAEQVDQLVQASLQRS